MSEQNKKAPEQYKGFLHLRCEECGATHTFCAKTPMRYYKCAVCGHHTELSALDRMELICECGSRSSYMTNEMEEVFDVNCVHCSAPVAMAWHAGRRRYMPCNLEEPPRRKRRRRR